MMAPARTTALVVVLAALLGGLPGAARALESLTFTAAAFEGEGFSSGPVEVRLGLGEGGRLELEATARSLSLPAPFDAARGARMRCPDARWDERGIDCSKGVLEVTAGPGEVTRIRLGVRWNAADGRLSLDAAEQAIAGGRAALRLDLGPGDTRVRSTFKGLDLATLAGAAALLAGPQALTVTAGTVSGRVEASRTGQKSRASAEVRFDALAYSDATGLRVGEALTGAVRLSGTGTGEAFEMEAALDLEAGLAYEDPLLVEFGGEPFTVRVDARADGNGTLAIREFSVHDPVGADVDGSARLSLEPQVALEALDLRVARVEAMRVYRRYLKALAGVGALSNLQLRGHLAGEVRWRAGAPGVARARLEALDLGDVDGRFGLYGLDGELHWQTQAPAPVSTLSWSGAQVYAVDIGGGRARARLAGRGLHLEEPFSVPVLDGTLGLERLEAVELGTAAQSLEADVEVGPMSLERLSNRLAWLPLAGSVSGNFPRLRYTDRRLEVNGDVRMRLFDGDVTVSGLALEDPFGVVPRLLGNVSIRGLDLEVLTRAFSFGSIEGRLDGEVRDLVLEGWQPLAFDATFLTPPDDPSRHRISQRAVDNLASLGGANAVLSSTFLRIFQEFSYDRLGLRCRLRAGVCEMGGVAPAERGYYIVKGGGLPPRVDVVGFNSRVDWATLVDRLKAVASSEGPVVR